MRPERLGACYAQTSFHRCHPSLAWDCSSQLYEFDVSVEIIMRGGLSVSRRDSQARQSSLDPDPNDDVLLTVRDRERANKTLPPTYESFFANKRITQMGLGILGRGVAAAKFLASCGAKLTVTDLRSEEQLASSLESLSELDEIRYVLGHHQLEDFRACDFVLKAPGIALDSPYLAEATAHDVPIEMDDALFAKLAPAKIIGVTGTRGKTTVASLIHALLKHAGRPVHLAGNIMGSSTLPLLRQVEPGDFVVLELSSWQLQGFGDAGLSPQVAVFTNFMRDHMDYYQGNMDRYFQDKANIFRYQKAQDVLVCGRDVADRIAQRFGHSIRSRMTVPMPDEVPLEWDLKLAGQHNRENAALAVVAARVLGLDNRVIREAVENFQVVRERLQLIRTVRGVRYINDTTATIPEATVAALKTVGNHDCQTVILLAGGADKGGLYWDLLAPWLKRHVKALVLFEGSASDRLLTTIGNPGMPVKTVRSMSAAVAAALSLAVSGDVVLLSPGAASHGLFVNEFDRGEQFTQIVSTL
jgi:UDP-N-acetylmuramoylalanine--D-glutamate ligase